MNDPVQLSVRTPGTNSGGPVVPVRQEVGQLDGRGDLLILIHGYNNSRIDALTSYGQFLDNLRTKFPTQTGQIAEFHWPGDELNKIISTLSYPNQIKPAIESARELATFLAGLQHAGPMVINLVGHSLGCRVIMELLAHWTGGLPPGIFIGAVILMAAAVKVKAIDEGGALRAAAVLTLKNPALYSKGDPVLKWAFPMGETAAGEGFFPTAVGRTGGPPSTWHVSTPMSHDGQAYVHGSYWPGDESSTAVAFALGGAPASGTPENAIASAPPPAGNNIT
ncbi:MAG TPA: alpha/beta hydrolase, partial [Candidatus Binatia bacterium]|nr:alpha/beta hydrolase [Candidatus Binatia bacterium]